MQDNFRATEKPCHHVPSCLVTFLPYREGKGSLVFRVCLSPPPSGCPLRTFKGPARARGPSLLGQQVAEQAAPTQPGPLQCYQCTPATLRSPGLRYCSGTVMGWKPREGELSLTASRQLFQLYLSPEAGSLLNAASCLLRSRGSDSCSCQSTCLLEHLPRAVFTKWAGGLVSCRRRLALTLS